MKASTSIFQDELNNLPPAWKLAPLGKKDRSGEVNPKAPYLSDWASTDVDREFIQTKIQSGKATGYGLRLGEPSGYVVAIDFDGQSAIEMGLENFGELPNTVTWTSGRPGRYQTLFVVPEQYRDRVKNKTVKTGVIGDDGKAEQIEFRYTGNQSALPPSPHPTTDGYHWINSPIDTPVAELPQGAIDYWLSLIAPNVTIKSKAKTKPESKLNSQAHTTLPIPLANCLAKSNRQLLRGVTEGGRNTAGATLSRDLIGAANYLASIGIGYDGDPRDLFDEFCHNCEPPIDDSEADVIWKSAEGDSPEPSCTAEGIDNIIEPWNRKADIDAELSQNLKESLSLKNGKAPNLFGGELGKLLSIAATNFNIPVEILNFCLMPILGSQIKSETDLLINPGTDYKVRAIRWCGLVGETGTKKSPIIDILTGAMSSIQREVAEVYKAEKLEYDAAFRAWKATKPADRGDEPTPVIPMMDLYFSDFTIESISQSISNHPHSGYLVYNDELAGFFKSMDAYRKNGGGDRQKWLTLYNGGALKVNRKSSDTIFIPQTSVSIVGGIQPSTIEHLISGDESQEDGLWNRFMFARLPQTRIDAFSHTPHSLTEHLEALYRSLAGQESFRHYLSEESKPLWSDWHRWTEDKTLSEPSWIARGTYAKIEGIAARNALIIHRTMAAIAGEIPGREISASTMATAIAWTKWELSQTLLEYQMLGLTNDPEQARILKFIDKFAGKGWISARDADRWWSARTKPPAKELREFMAKVVRLGQAIDNDEAIDSSKYRIQILSNGSDSSDKNPVNGSNKQIGLSLSVVTNFENEEAKHLQNGDSRFVTTDRLNGSDKLGEHQNGGAKVRADEFVTNFRTNGSDKPEKTLNSHHSQQSNYSVTKLSDSVDSIHSKQFGDSVTTVTTVPNKNIFKIGDRAKLGEDVITINQITDEHIGGITDDGSPIGGHPNLLKPSDIEPERPKSTPNGYTKKDAGDGFIEIVSNRSDSSDNTAKNNDDAGEIEYEC